MTSQAACTATHMHEGWVVQPGYAVDDDRKSPPMREIKAAWKVRRDQLGIEDKAVSQGWD
jgi:hypothetical protein